MKPGQIIGMLLSLGIGWLAFYLYREWKKIEPPEQSKGMAEVMGLPPALAWFRASLWLAPTSFFLANLIAFSFINRKLSLVSNSDALMWVILALSAAFTFGTGWFRMILSPDPPAMTVDKVSSCVIFLALQIVVVPIISSMIVFLLILME